MKSNHAIQSLRFIITFFLILVFQATSLQAAPTGKLIMFHAGSLSVPFAAMEKAFEAKFPGVDLLREAGGSTKMARLISEVGKPADLMASADYKVIDSTLMPEIRRLEHPLCHQPTGPLLH